LIGIVASNPVVLGTFARRENKLYAEV
jgi:hypothetical protein